MKITITVNGEKIDVRFGLWTLSELAKRGYKLVDLKKILEDDPFGFIPVLTYLGACGIDRDLYSHKESDFWDHYEKVGFDNEDVARLIQFFTDSISKLVTPQEKKSTTKKAEVK